ncbi:tyrosine-type recombinase/integrase [Collimonas pratensis]|uniref:tyrosine-type recombinase/integrase n=1 Tax=Collimonas pratensis TaxID=279113 RepID=UPI00123746F2|nr:tyrosine-type recombinase/integrase [Collimonas pratensis]
MPKVDLDKARSGHAGRFDEARVVRNTEIDFGSLGLPKDVCAELVAAFWSHIGMQSENSILTQWFHVRVFARFAHEMNVIQVLADLNGNTLVRYVEWLNTQTKADGSPWSKSGRAGPYTTLRKMLQWIERCRPGVLPEIEYPFNPFPWRNRDTPSRSKMPPRAIRDILRACESDIVGIRARRDAVRVQRTVDCCSKGTLAWLLESIDRNCGGIVPMATQLSKSGMYDIRIALERFGGLKGVEPCLYPRAESLLPYYLAIMIHAAGNPDPIVELRRDCLQAIPLLDERQALLWFKARANGMQRRTFSNLDPFEPPALVKEIIDWNERLIPFTPAKMRDRLFIYKGIHGVTSLSSSAVKHLLKSFCERHNLQLFSLASIRPSVLTSFYRASGDLRRVKNIANHAHISTTIRYVETPEVVEQNRVRIAELQQAFVGHIQKRKPDVVLARPSQNSPTSFGRAVSMFGFDCSDPFAGLAPGSHRGEICNQFMGCFTCPNAVITSDPLTLARLLQAKDHLKQAATTMHPARWEAVYAPQLRILEYDILPRFASAELASAEAMRKNLAALPDLR